MFIQELTFEGTRSMSVKKTTTKFFCYCAAIILLVITFEATAATTGTPPYGFNFISTDLETSITEKKFADASISSSNQNAECPSEC